MFITVRSRRTGNSISIRVSDIIEVIPRPTGSDIVRKDKPVLGVTQSAGEVERMIDPPVQQSVSVRQTTQHTTNHVHVQPRQRSSSVVDTAIGVGAGILGAEVVGEIIDSVFDTDWF